MAAFLAFLKAVPAVIDLINKISKLIQENNYQAWQNDLDSTIDLLEKKDSSLQDKVEAAKRLADLTRRLR